MGKKINKIWKIEKLSETKSRSYGKQLSDNNDPETIGRVIGSDTTLFKVESPVIIWVEALRAYLLELDWTSYVENQCKTGGFSGSFQRGTSVVSVFVVHERNNVALLLHRSEQQR